MKRHISVFALLLSAFAAAGFGSDVMRLSPIGYRLGETGDIMKYDSSVVTVTPGDTSIVVSNKSQTLTAVLNRDYKVVRWQKFDDDPTRRTELDPIEEFGEGSGTVSVNFNPNVEWMYVTVVVKYDPVRTVKASVSSFGDGTVAVSPAKTSYQKGDVVTLTAEPAEGYSFVRWSDGNIDHRRTLTVDDDVDLTAYIEPDSSRVSFSAGAGAVLGVTSKRVSFGNAYGELPVPTRTGAKFSGWTDDEKRTVTAKTEVNRTADHTLYASWSDLLYEITWDFTGRGNGKVEGTGTYAYGSQPTLKAVPYEGSAFTGWTDGVTLNPRRITVLSNALYVAAFDVATYDVTFTYRDASGNLVTTGPTSVEHGGKVDPPSVPEWPEHTFRTWSTEEYKRVTRDLAVEAIYDTMTYSVAFAYRDWQGNSVTTMPQHVVSGGKANPPDRSVVDNWTGHAFKGWQPDYNVIRADTLCEAIYDDVRCTVKFSYRDKDGNPVTEDVTVKYGEAVLETSVPPKSKVDQWPDHEFLGWDERYAEATNRVTRDFTVYAKYKDVITVIYSPGKGQGDRLELELDEAGSYAILNPTNDLNYSRTGYTFDYWQSDDETNYQPGDTVKLKAGDTLALTAHWAPNSYTVTYHKNDGTEVRYADPKLFFYDIAGSLISYTDFARYIDYPTGYELKGLFTDREWDGKTPLYKLQGEVTNLTAEADAVVDLYAIWQGKPQKVEINGVATNVAYGSQLWQPADPVKTGYTFTGGWTTNGVPVAFPITVTGSFKLNSENKWTPNEYTVVFHGTDADGGAMEPQAFAYDVAQALTSNAFTRTGYTFANWTNEVGTAFADGAWVKNLATNDGAVVGLYATWTMNPRYYAVKFNPNGSTGAPYVQDIECGVETALMTNRFARTGYGFANWTNATGTVYADGAKVTDLAAEGETNDLYAVWTPNSCWVKFEGNGADGGTMAAQAFAYDEAQALTANAFTRTGYGFAGWVTNLTGSAVFADGAVVSNLTAEANATNTLWATWTANKYTVVIDGVPTEMDYGSDIAKPADPAAREGYTFTGWTTNGVPVAVWPLKVPLGGLAILSAWAANAYTVEFRGPGETYTQGFTYDEPQALEANRFPAPEMMVFDCWTNAVDSTTYADGEVVSNLTTGGVFALYATWKDAPSYTVAFDANGGEGEMPALRFECGAGGKLGPNKFTRTGYAFDKWTNRVNGATYADGATFAEDLAPTNGTATLSALWTPNRYRVKFDGNCSTDGTMEAQAFTYDAQQALTSNAFTKTGYSFDGWKTNETGSAVFGDGAVVSNLTTEADATNTLWATWTANHYTVRFNPNGGSGDVTTQGFTYDQPQNLADNTFDPPELKSFAGWATNETGKAVYANGAEVQNLTAEANGTVNLYAVWGDDSYTVAFNGNGATGTMEPQVFKHGETDPLTSNAFTRTGCGFAGWADSEGSVVTKYADGANFTAPATGIGETLYAVWTNCEYYCWFDDEKDGPYHYGDKVERSDPTKLGYVFLGWTNETGVVDLNTFTMPDHDVVFGSKWTPITYTIAFDGNGATDVAMASTNVKYDVEIALPSNTYVWAGREFVHWTNSVGNVFEDGKTVKNLATTDGATVTLYAVWQETGNPLAIALGLDANFDVEVSNEGAWTIVGEAKGKNGLSRTSSSPAGTLRVTVPSGGRLTITFDPEAEATGLGLTVTMDGDPEPWFEDEPGAMTGYPLETDRGGTFVFSGVPSAGATWTLKNFKWTAK